MNFRNLFKGIITILIIAIIMVYFVLKESSHLPIIAIANWGPHSSLSESIKGMKEELQREGFVEGKNIQYEIADVGFDQSLIPQMITKLKSQNPKIMVTLSTPIAQFTKGSIKNIPLVYNAITDPVEAGLIKEPYQAYNNITGSSDKQDLKIFLKFVKKLLPLAHTVGMLYSTAESNDIALVKMMNIAAKELGMKVMAISVDQARDVPIRMQAFKGMVDFIYVGTSGPIQPTLPVIAAESKKMRIPVFNADEGAVKDGIALASFGVNYRQVGVNAGRLVAQLLNNVDIIKLAPIYPSLEDYHAFINRKKAMELDLKIPDDLNSLEIIE